MKFIPEGLGRTIAMTALKTQKSSPKIFFVAGVGGTIVSAVLACRATLKLEEKLEEFSTDVEALKEAEKSIGIGPDAYTRELHYKNFGYVYTKNTLEIVRLYGPAVLLGAASVAALAHSHNTLTRRNAALSAAYSAVAASYEAYRGRVREELGDERELDIYHNARREKSKDAEGKALVVKVADPNGMSPYAMFFDSHNVNWKKSAELNRLFITCQQNYANQRLIARGHVFLNEVYEDLGMPHTQAGAVVGWVMSNDPEHKGDNYIDFGMFTAYNSEFVNGFEPTILLDFNVDGVIFDLI